MVFGIPEEGEVLCCAGWVRTDMTGGNGELLRDMSLPAFIGAVIGSSSHWSWGVNAGLIDVDQCVSGLISVLESGKPLNGRFFDYKDEEIPW